MNELASEETLLVQTIHPDNIHDYQDVLYRLVLTEDEDEQNELGWRLLRHLYEMAIEDSNGDNKVHKEIEVATSIIFMKLKHLTGDELLRRRPLLLSIAITFDDFLIDHLESSEDDGFDFSYYIDSDIYIVAKELRDHESIAQADSATLPLEAYRSVKELSDLTRGELNALVLKVQSHENALKDISPTLLPLFRLALFEYFLHNPIFDQEKFDKLLRKFQNLNELEILDQTSPIPIGTIGLELESSQDGFSDNLIAFLVKFGMQLTRETDTLCEISFPFSYSTSVQSRYLQVLFELGLFKNVSETRVLYDIKGKGFTRDYHHIEASNSTSIHFNYGVPSGIEYDDFTNDPEHAIKKIAALLGLGYSSPHRLLHRKTTYGLQIVTDAELNATTSPTSGDDQVGTRVEYRLAEFNDKTYRSLEAFQIFMYALMVYTKYKKGVKLNENEDKVLDCFAHFLDDINGVLAVKLDGEELTVDLDVIDDNKASLSGSQLEKVLTDSELNLQARCYKLAEEYSYKFRAICYG